MTEKEQLQLQISEAVQIDFIKVVTDYSDRNNINLDDIILLIQKINLFEVHNTKYIQNPNFNETLIILEDQLNKNDSPVAISLLSVVTYMLNPNLEFRQILFINLCLKSNKMKSVEMLTILSSISPSVENLFKNFIKYIFNEKFLDLDEIVQIELIFKVWSFSRELFHDNEASKHVYKELLKLFKEALKLEKTEVAFWLYYTPLHYFNSGTGTDIDYLNEKFKIEVEKPLENYILNKLVPKYNILPNTKIIDKNKKIKVAFLMQRLIEHSTIKVLYSLIKSLMKTSQDRYEFILYDMAFAESGGSQPEIVSQLKNTGVKYINLHKKIFGKLNPTYSLLEKCIKTREVLINDEIDVLIGLHSRIEYLFFYATRTAPKQIYWYHSSNAQYDIKGIDFRIKHGDFTIPEVKHDNFNFLQFGDLIEKDNLNPVISEKIIYCEKNKFPKNSIIMGTIGRLSKIDSKEYIKVIDNILEKNPNTIYIAAGNGDKESIKSKINEQTISRWFFVGQIDAHLYGNIIDVWPNTFPLPQGLSTLEFMAKGKPVLTMKNDFHDFEVQNAANLKRTDKFKEFKMNVDNVNDYIKSLELLIKSKDARELLGKKNLDYIEEFYYNTTSSIQRFYEILEEVTS